MRPITRPLLLVTALVVLATPALADPSASSRAGLRYLQWPGKAEQPAQQASSQANGASRSAHLRAPLRPDDAPASAPEGANRYSFTSQATARPYGPSGVYDPPAPPPTPIASMALVPAPPAEPAPAPETAYDAPPAAGAPLASPMMTAQLAPAPAAPIPTTMATDRPRLYSLHREYGEQPDRTEIPAPVYLDALPIDLAAPPPHEPARDKNGKPVRSDPGDPARVEP